MPSSWRLAHRILRSPQRLNALHYEALTRMVAASRAPTSVCASEGPSISTFDARLVECVRSGDDGALNAVAQLMRLLGATPSGETYGALILARLERGELTRAMRVWSAALTAGLPPEPAVVDQLVLALIHDGLSGSALELLTDLRVRHGRQLPPGSATNGVARRLIEGAAHAYEMPLEVLSVHKELRHHVDRVHDELVEACALARNVPAATALLRQLDADGVRLGDAALDSLLSALLDASNLPEAIRIFETHSEPRAWRFGGETDYETGDDTPGGAGTAQPTTAHLELSDLGPGTARLQLIHTLQRLAVEAVTYPSSRPFPSEMRVVVRRSHAEQLISTAASLSPTLPFREHPSAGAAGDALGCDVGAQDSVDESVMLVAGSSDLEKWADDVSQQRDRAQQQGHVALVAVGHNALWTLALLGWIL